MNDLLVKGFDMVTLIVICSNCEWDVGNRTQLRNVSGSAFPFWRWHQGYLQIQRLELKCYWLYHSVIWNGCVFKEPSLSPISFSIFQCLVLTPLKIKMKPKNHPIERGNHLPNLQFWVQHVHFPGWCQNATFRCLGQEIDEQSTQVLIKLDVFLVT